MRAVALPWRRNETRRILCPSGEMRHVSILAYAVKETSSMVGTEYAPRCLPMFLIRTNSLPAGCYTMPITE